MTLVIELLDINKTYTLGELEVRALRGVSLTIERGEFASRHVHGEPRALGRQPHDGEPRERRHNGERHSHPARFGGAGVQKENRSEDLHEEIVAGPAQRCAPLEWPDFVAPRDFATGRSNQVGTSAGSIVRWSLAGRGRALAYRPTCRPAQLNVFRRSTACARFPSASSLSATSLERDTLPLRAKGLSRA